MNAKFYVPFETAKMLRVNGYPQKNSDKYYTMNGVLLKIETLDERYKEELPIALTDYYAAPAYCEVLDWLVGKGIGIDVNSMPHGKWYCCIWTKNSKSMLDSTSSQFSSEQAINEAIVRALEEI